MVPGLDGSQGGFVEVQEVNQRQDESEINRDHVIIYDYARVTPLLIKPWIILDRIKYLVYDIRGGVPELAFLLVEFLDFELGHFTVLQAKVVR